MALFSNQKPLFLLESATVDSGWWVSAWTLDGSTKLVDPLPCVSATFEKVINEIGYGSIEIPAAHEDIADLLCNPQESPQEGALLKVYIDGVEEYSFEAFTRKQDYREDGLIHIGGPGREAQLDRTIVFPADAPATPTTAGSYIYGSGDNLVEEGNFEGNENNAIQNGDFESGDALGWEPMGGDPVAVRAADGAVFRSGSWGLRVIPTNGSGVGTGVETDLLGPQGSPIQNQIITSLWVKNLVGGDTITAELWSAGAGIIDQVQINSTTTWQLMSLVGFAPTSNETVKLRVYNSSGTNDFYIDDAIALYDTDPWVPYGSGDQFHLDFTKVAEGALSLKVVPDAQNGGVGRLISTTPNQYYRFTVNVQGTAGETIEASAAVENGYVQESVVVDGTVTFHQITVEFTTAADETAVQLWVRNKNAGPSPFWLDDVKVTPGYPSTSPGEPMGLLMDLGIARGSLTNFSYSFSDSLDSSGATWLDSALALKIDFGVSYKSVLDQLVGLGFEWMVSNSFELRLQNRIGNDLTQLGDLAPILYPGRGAESSRETKKLPEATFVFVEGAEGRWTTAHNPAWELNILRRERFLSNTEVQDSTTLAKYGQAALTEQAGRAQSWSIRVSREDEFRPFRDFNVGDTIWVDLFEDVDESDPQAYRVRGVRVTLTGESDEITYEVMVNHITMEFFAAQAHAVRRLIEKGTQDSLGLSSGTVGTVSAGGGSGGGGETTTTSPHSHTFAEITGKTAGGDLAGTYPNPLVQRLLNKRLAAAPGAGDDGKVYVFDESADQWVLDTAAATLGALTDVDLTTTPPTDGQAILFDDASGLWVPGDAGSGGGGGGSPLWIQDVDDPLTSLADLTTYSGAWAINTYLECTLPGSTQCRAYSDTPVTAIGLPTMVEVEIEIPTWLPGGTNTRHVRVGIGPSNTAGPMNFALRGDGNAYFEADAAVAVATAPYTIPAAGTWVKLRMVATGDRFTGYIDGVKYLEITYSRNTNGPIWYPYVAAYSNVGGTVRFRNLKAWTLAGVDTDAVGGGGGGGAVPAYISHRASPVDTPVWADEFNDEDHSAWTQLLPTGTMSVAEGRDVLSLHFDAQASSDMAGVVQALPGGLPAIYAIEWQYRVHTYRADYLMAGPFVGDGLLETSNVTWWMPFWGSSSFIDSLRSGTPQNIGSNHGDQSRYPYGAMGVDSHMIRLVIDTNDNSIRVERSIDGVQWSLAGLAAFDRVLTFTPATFGFGVSTWGGNAGTAWERMVAVDYVRFYDLTV